MNGLENLLGTIFWLVIIFIWIISPLIKKKQRESQRREEPPSEIEEEILETLGLPVPQIPQEMPEPAVEKKQEKQVYFEIQEKKEKPVVKAGKPKIIAQIEEESPDLASSQKVEEGIVLSIILGPPKAYQFISR